MPYYEDLTEYVYSKRSEIDAVNVGWLDSNHEFRKGQVDADILLKIGECCKNPLNRKRGYQHCVFCKDHPVRELIGASRELTNLGDAEICIRSAQKAYVCPTLIYHYIAKHGYKPPDEFLDAVKLENRL
jgi:hypothetical protein